MPTELIKLHTYSQQHIRNRTRTIYYSREKMSLAPATPEKNIIHEKCMTRYLTSITLLQPRLPLLYKKRLQIPSVSRREEIVGY